VAQTHVSLLADHIGDKVCHEPLGAQFGAGKRASVKPSPFEYHRPATLTEATQALADLGDMAKVVAGGQSLVPMLALRLAAFDHLVDIGRIAEMQGIERRDDSVWIGAATREAAVEFDPMVAEAVPLLHRATPFIGHMQIRNRGTVGGSIAHADPAAEYPAVARALDAELHVASPSGRRTIPAAEFFEGLWTTSMAPEEILVGTSFPIWHGRTGFAVEEVARRHGDFALAGAVVGVQLDGDDRLSRCAIGLFGMGSVPERAQGAETELANRAVGDIDATEVGRLAVSGLLGVPDDLHATSGHRTKMASVLVSRAWSAACEEARTGARSEEAGRV
jgi:carbon-monoxide dehydrogenase medium subunit